MQFKTGLTIEVEFMPLFDRVSFTRGRPERIRADIEQACRTVLGREATPASWHVRVDAVETPEVYLFTIKRDDRVLCQGKVLRWEDELGHTQEAVGRLLERVLRDSRRNEK